MDMPRDVISRNTLYRTNSLKVVVCGNTQDIHEQVREGRG